MPDAGSFSPCAVSHMASGRIDEPSLMIPRRAPSMLEMPSPTRKSPYAFLAPLPRQTRGGTVQRVQEVIRDAIVRLDLPPGTAIDKVALCARLGVSRFSVSQALGRLAGAGFV